MVVISPIFPEPILKIDCEERKESFLVVSDLHLGFISKYHQKGVFINYKEHQNEMMDKIISIGKKNNCSNLIILGDLKDSIGYPNKEERSIIPDFLKNISSSFDVYFVPGNHDGSVLNIIPESVVTYSSSGMLLEDCILHHGHVMPKKVPSSIKKMVMGHVHPIFNKSHSLIHGERIWIFMKVDKGKVFGNKNSLLSIMIIPTYNKIYYSNPLSSNKKSISPLINKILKEDAIIQSFIFTLDGDIVGDISDLDLR